MHIVVAARLQLVYINSIRGANRLWGKTPMGRNVLPWGDVSMGRNVRGAKSPDTLKTDRTGDCTVGRRLQCACTTAPPRGRLHRRTHNNAAEKFLYPFHVDKLVHICTGYS